MSMVRQNSQQSFKPIPEDTVTHHTHKSYRPDADPGKGRASQGPETPEANGTPEATIQELRKILKDLNSDGEGARGGGGGGWGGGSLPGSRPPSRSSMRSSSRQGSRLTSRRNSWVQGEDEDDDVQVTSSQKAHLLVASQQRLVYTLQGLRHELSSLDEEVNRIRNDILNSRRFYNAMRGIQEQPTWGSSWRKNNYGSGSSSPSMYSLDNSYSDETDSLARNESFSSFASWRSEAELFNVFRDAEEAFASDKGSSKSDRASATNRSDTSTSNDNGSNSSTGSMAGHHPRPSSRNKDGTTAAGATVIRGRYRQLAASGGGNARR